MNIIVMNKNFERIGLIENASVIWATRYYQCGDFELYMSATEAHISLISDGYYVVRDEDKDNIGVIEDFELTNKTEEGDMLTVTGRFAPMILEKRIISQQTQLNGNAETSIRNLILTNVINPVKHARKIECIALGEKNSDITERLEIQATGDNLETKIEEICQSLGLGFRMPYRNNKIYFEMYKGVDRSYNQTKNPHIIFSDKYDNLSESVYQQTTSIKKNVFLIATEGEGLQRTIAWGQADTSTTNISKSIIEEVESLRSATKKIEECIKAIEDAEKDIERNKENIEETKAEIKEVEAEKAATTDEKEIEKLEKEITRLNEKITEYNTEITKLENEITTNTATANSCIATLNKKLSSSLTLDFLRSEEVKDVYDYVDQMIMTVYVSYISGDDEKITGLERNELYVDARNMSANEDDIPFNEYYQQMVEEGKTNLVTTNENFEGTTLLKGYKYGKPENGGDFFLGDIVTIENTNWGLYINVRVIEYIESCDENGTIETITFEI